MIIVNPLMTVWLISCVTYYVGSSKADRNISLRGYGTLLEDDDDPSDLYKPSADRNNIASFKFNPQRLLFSGKKNTTANTTTTLKTTTKTVTESTCLKLTTRKQKETTCYMGKSTKAKKKKTTTEKNVEKHTKKSKTSYSDSSKKWKKIQKFFFGPPNWSLKMTKDYSMNGQVTPDSKDDMDVLRPNQVHQQIPEPSIYQNMPDISSTQILLHQIPIDYNNELKRINPKNELQRDFVTNESPQSNEKVNEVIETINNNNEPKKINLLQQKDQHEEMNQQQNDKQDKQIIHETEHIQQPELILQNKWNPNQEIPHSSIAIPVLENQASKETVNQQDNTLPKSSNFLLLDEQVPSKEEMKPNNSREALSLENQEMINTSAFEEPFSGNFNSGKGSTSNLRDGIEILMTREDSKQYLGPETIAELRNNENKTNIFKQYFKKLHNKNTLKGQEYIFKQLENPSNDYFSNETDQVTDEVNTFKVHNELNDNKLGFDNRFINENEKKYTKDSQKLLKAFGQFLRNNYPEMVNRSESSDIGFQSKNKLASSNRVFENENLDSPKMKQHYNVITEHIMPFLNDKNLNSHSRLITEPNTPSKLDSMLIFGKPTRLYSQVTETKGFLKDVNPEKNKLEEKVFKYLTTFGLGELNFGIPHNQIVPTNKNRNDLKAYGTTAMFRHDLNNYQQKTDFPHLTFPNNFNRHLPPSVINNYTPVEKNNMIYNPYTLKEPFKDNTLQKGFITFEDIRTIPSLISTDSNVASKNEPMFKDIFFGKKLNENPSAIITTIGPLMINNYLSQKPVETPAAIYTQSSSTEMFNDIVPFDNVHEFNSDHHLSSTTLKAASNSYKDLHEWNIPIFKNEFSTLLTIPARLYRATDTNYQLEYKNNSYGEGNEFDIKSAILPFKDYFTIHPYSVFMPVKQQKTDSEVFSHPVKRPDWVKHIDTDSERITSSEFENKNERDNREMGSHISLQRLGEKLFHGNLEPYKSIKQQLLINHNPKFQHENFLPTRKKSNENIHDFDNLLASEVFRNNFQSSAEKKDKQESIEKSIVDERKVTKILMEDDNENGVSYDRLKNDVWDGVVGSTMPRTEEPYKDQRRFQLLSAEVDNLLNQVSTAISLNQLNSLTSTELVTNKPKSMFYYGSKTSAENPLIYYQSENNALPVTDYKLFHKYENEKFLTNGTGISNEINKVPLSFKDNSNVSQDALHFLNSFFNQSMSGVPDKLNKDKNEISAVQMSVVKIFRKNPEILNSQFDLPENFSFNESYTKNKLITPLLTKMKEIFNEIGKEKKIKKRNAKMEPLHSEADRENINISKGKNSEIVTEKMVMMSIESMKNKDSFLQFEIPTTNIGMLVSCGGIAEETFQRGNETSLTQNNTLKCSNLISDLRHYKIPDGWKESMQSLIDKRIVKRNIEYDIYDESVQKDPGKIISYAINNNLQHLEIEHKPLENFLGKQVNQDINRSDDVYENQRDIIFTDVNQEKIKRNILGNKKMKSRELEYILEKNLPGLSLNKGQFISYMMTGMKNANNLIPPEDEKHSHLSKSSLQNLIDKNAKKERWAAETSQKRNRKKQWLNK